MKNIASYSLRWIRIVCVSTLIVGCSYLPDNLSQQTLSNNQVQQNVETDYWNDNSKSWNNWSVNNPTNKDVIWSRAEDAIQAKFSASSELNTFGQRAHTLNVKIIQLTDISGINTLFQTTDGITAVLSQSIEMIPNAVFSESFIVAPKQEITFNLAREENVKYIAIVAGFAALSKNQVIRIMPISVNIKVQEPIKAEWSIVDYLTLRFFAEKEIQPDIVRPSKLRLNIRLGESSITEFSAIAS
jgi:predicted component of type VI protein secretion system